MKYYINNCFFVRVTNESIEKRDMLEKMYKGEISINDFIEMNPQFLEALMNSNYLLYQLIKDNQVSENQKKTIARYFQRSIIRPTPYGLFAGITTGNFGEYTDFCRKSIARSTWGCVEKSIQISQFVTNALSCQSCGVCSAGGRSQCAPCTGSSKGSQARC